MLRSFEHKDVLMDALDNISEAFVIYDKSGYLVTCNEKFRELYGYSTEQTRAGVHFRELGELDMTLGNVVLGDEYGSGDEYLRRKDEYRKTLKGSFIVKMTDGRWIKTTDRRLSSGGFVSVQSDITDLKLNEQLLLQAKENAELANRAKSEFMANMSHELRTPLNAIIGFSSLLSSEVYGAHSDSRYKEYAGDVQNAGSHLLTLINELLDLAKIETGDIQLDEKQTDIVQLTQSCKTMVSARAMERNIKITTHIASSDLCLMADPIRLKQILVNLLGNAVKFSHPNGEVEVTWRMIGGQIELTVKDDGVGIEQEFLPHLYQPFRRSRIAQNLQYEGTGLGLTLVKRFSDAHDAELILKSKANEGTKVRLIFPSHRTVKFNEEIAS
ncbi:hypothetical protein A9Q83_16835 [Alphaproteobacteria bacterium 46_93_T64]|nr:hypothetical protein A9Q83_16835 [Alphaproteobacteria bacterium 46_93_T64]